VSERIDMETAMTVITDCLNDARMLHDTPLPDASTPNRNRAEADLSRRTLHLADQLQMAAGLVRNEYWALKGLTSYDL